MISCEKDLKAKFKNLFGFATKDVSSALDGHLKRLPSCVSCVAIQLFGRFPDVKDASDYYAAHNMPKTQA